MDSALILCLPSKIHTMNVQHVNQYHVGIMIHVRRIVNEDFHAILGEQVDEKAAMVEWLRCSTRIHKVLCSNLSITIHGMTLDKSLTAQLSRMTHSYHTEYIISQYVGRKGVQIPPSVKRKRR